MTQQDSRSNSTLNVVVEVLGTKCIIQCTEDTKQELLDSENLLNDRIATIKSVDVVLTHDLNRVIITAALNLANELLKERRRTSVAVNDEIDMRVDALIGMLDNTLKQS